MAGILQDYSEAPLDGMPPIFYSDVVVVACACCVLHAVCCVLRVACCVLRVACCVLRVACCAL